MKISITKDRRNKKRPHLVRWYEFSLSTGKKKRCCKSFKRKSDAQDFAAKLRTNPPNSRVKDDITLEQFCKDWLSVKRSNYRQGTITLYENAIERLKNFFGSQRLIKEITPYTAARFIAQLKPLVKRKPLSNWSKSRTLRNCKTIFEAAAEWGLLKRNPFAEIKKPKCFVSRWHYITPDEYRRLLDVSPTLRWKAFYTLAYTAGLRLGELLSLQWDRIDFQKEVVRIENRPESDRHPPFFVKDTEARTIPLSKHSLEIIDNLRMYNYGTDEQQTGTPYLFLNRRQYETLKTKWQKRKGHRKRWTNRDYRNNTLTSFKRHCRKAGISPDGKLNIHGLRKSCIQNWSKAPGLIAKTVQVLAGHADLATTMRYYVQVDAQQLAQATAVIDDLFEKRDVCTTYEGKK